MELFRTIVKGLKDVVLCFDERLEIIYASDNVSLMWQREKDEVLNRSLNEVLPESCYKVWAPPLERAFDSGEELDVEVTCEEKEFLVHLIPDRNEDGQVEKIVAVCRDITREKKLIRELKDKEARLLDVQRLVQLGYWWWDVKTGEVEWSDEVFKIFHLDPKTFTPQIDSIQALSPWPEEHKRDKELIDKAIKSREAGYYEQRFLYPDGSIGHYSSTFKGIYENDELVAIKGTVQDITRRKRTEEEKERLEKQYQQAQKIESIGRLAGGIAHDLNNLLTPIIGCSELLKEDLKEDDTDNELIDGVLEAGLKARDLVGQLLAYGRRQTLEYSSIDLNDVVSGFHTLLRRTIREDIEIKLVLSDENPTIKADIGQIEQVMMNLSVNAQDAMASGGILTIETALTELDESYVEAHMDVLPGKYALLAISDTGVGIDEETKAKIFEPFYSKKGELGTGLGLATVYGVVKQHRGNIFVYSEPNVGTTMKVYLPISEETSTVNEIVDAPVELRGSERILIVEDNMQVRTLAKNVLQRLGYDVIVAPNGKDAIELLEALSGSVDLLLTDVIMPIMNGKEVYERATKLFPRLKVVYMSGYTDNVIAHSGVIDRGIAFVAKPFTKESLARKIRIVLDED